MERNTSPIETRLLQPHLPTNLFFKIKYFITYKIKE